MNLPLRPGISITVAILAIAVMALTAAVIVHTDVISLSAAEPQDSPPMPRAGGRVVLADPPPELAHEVLSGGPPPDGIPSLDRPAFEGLESTSVPDDEGVLVLQISDIARAYPLRHLMWHEIINDVLGGTPVVVTWCPLCDSAIAFDRRVDGQTLEFGVSGNLRRSNMIAFDRQTGSLWQQADGRCLAGPLQGQHLREIPLRMTSVGQLRLDLPTARIMQEPNGHLRDYGRNPYVDYDDLGNQPWGRFIAPIPPTPVPAMTRVVAIADGPAWHAFAAPAQPGLWRVRHPLGPLLVWARPGLSSALSGERLSDGRPLMDLVVWRESAADEALPIVSADGRHLHTADGAELLLDALPVVPFRQYLAFAWYAFFPTTGWLEAERIAR